MTVKMDKTMIIVSSVVGSLGVLSAILGFSAEGTKLTIYNILVIGDACVYPPNPALALGVCAAVFLVMAQITVAAVGGCCGCCKSRAIPSETKRIVGVICAVVSWIAAVIAWALFIEGAAWNAEVARDTAPVCYVLKDGIFAGASVLTLVATALGITSYIMLRTTQPDAAAAAEAAAASKPGEQPPPAGIAMGQPQFPPPQGYAQAPNYPQYPPPASPPRAYGGQAPNPQYPPPPPAQGYGSHAPDQQFSPPAQGYGSHEPNQQFPTHPQGHAKV